MAIKNYDLNIRQGIHTVRVTIQQYGYVGHITLKIHGNCKGKDILDYLDFECEDAESMEENDCNLQYDEWSDNFSAILKDESGNTLEVEGDAGHFNAMIVAVEIVDFVKE